jgi:serine/threonine protein kinase
MMNNKILEYEITDKLYESECTIVYRGYRNQDRLPLVLKVLKAEAATKEKLAAFEHEFDITSKLDLPAVVKSIALTDDDGRRVMVMEDLGGQSLDRILDPSPPALEPFLALAVSLTVCRENEAVPCWPA